MVLVELVDSISHDQQWLTIRISRWMKKTTPDICGNILKVLSGYGNWARNTVRESN